MAKTNDALKILDRMIGADAAMRQRIAEETLKAQMARMSYAARAWHTARRRPGLAVTPPHV